MRSLVGFSLGFLLGRVSWPLVKHLAYWLLIVAAYVVGG